MDANNAEYEVIPGINLKEDELIERFVRSSGPGGQNVNKVSSACELRFATSGRLALGCRTRLKTRVLAARDRRLTNEGVLVLQAQRFRTLERNRADAKDRLLALLRTHTIEQKKRPSPPSPPRPPIGAASRPRRRAPAPSEYAAARARRMSFGLQQKLIEVPALAPRVTARA